MLLLEPNIVPILQMNLHFLSKNEKTQQEVATFIKKWDDSSIYFENKTSGSTGNPKKIELKKEHATVSAKATLSFFGIKKGDTALLCLNFDTIGGKMMAVRSIVGQLQLYVAEPSTNPLNNNNISIDFIALAPIQLHTILNENPKQLKPIRVIIVGGGVVSEETEKLLKQHSITVYQTFGMTETISHIALRKVGFESEENYTILNHVEISEENGQLCIHAPLIGIENLKTNDLVKIVSKNQFKWIGRADFVINSGGIKIQIEELEHELSNYIQQRFFIYKRMDEKLGEKVVLVVEGDENESLKSKQFYSFLSNKYHIPKEVAFVEKIIRTSSDKVNRIANFEQINEFKQVL